MQRLGWLTVLKALLQTAVPGGGTDGVGLATAELC